LNGCEIGENQSNLLQEKPNVIKMAEKFQKSNTKKSEIMKKGAS